MKLLKYFNDNTNLIRIAFNNAVHFRDEYDVFILLSGDSDFESLIKYLKVFSKQCLVMSIRDHVSIELVRQAKFLDFKKIRKEIELT